MTSPSPVGRQIPAVDIGRTDSWELFLGIGKIPPAKKSQNATGFRAASRPVKTNKMRLPKKMAEHFLRF